MTVRAQAIGFVVAAIAAICAAPAAGANLDLPAGPQLQDLPGASSVPDLSHVNGLPGIPGITNDGVDATAGQGPTRSGPSALRSPSPGRTARMSSPAQTGPRRTSGASRPL